MKSSDLHKRIERLEREHVLGTDHEMFQRLAEGTYVAAHLDRAFQLCREGIRLALFRTAVELRQLNNGADVPEWPMELASELVAHPPERNHPNARPTEHAEMVLRKYDSEHSVMPFSSGGDENDSVRRFWMSSGILARFFETNDVAWVINRVDARLEGESTIFLLPPAPIWEKAKRVATAVLGPEPDLPIIPMGLDRTRREEVDIDGHKWTWIEEPPIPVRVPDSS